MNEQLIAAAVAAALKAVEAQPSLPGIPADSLAAKMGFGRTKDGKKATGSPVGPWLHGPQGLARNIDGEHPILSAMIRPMGLLGVLPILRGDRHVTEFIPTFTGVTAATGEEPEEICDDPPTAGLKKLCTLAVPFGRKRFKTREWHLARLGKLQSRSEELSLGADFPAGLLQGDALTPSGIPTGGAEVFRSELANRLFEVGVAFQRYFGPVLYSGDPSNNTGTDPDTAGYKESMGLDLWINAGNKRDAYSSALCSALDSLLMDFDYNKVDGATPSIVRYITQAWRWVNWNAMRMGLAPATWTMGVRPDLFHEITDLWPCSYLSHRCADQSGANIVVLNDEANVRMRDEMRNGSFLWIDGVQVPVTMDMNIVEETFVDGPGDLLDGEYASDIYFVPLTVLGGMRVTGFQYFDHRISVAENAIARRTHYWTTDNGLFLWNSTEKDLCLDMRALTEWRLIMQTPQIAARIQNVKYSPLEHLRESDPDALYYRDGGVTGTDIETFYNAWDSAPAQF